MKSKSIIFIINLLKIMSVIFIISALGSFITTIILNSINGTDDIKTLLLYIFSNFGVTLFSRLVMAVFFFAFAIFIEEWLKAE